MESDFFVCGILGIILGDEIPDFPVYASLKVLENAKNRGDDGSGLLFFGKKSYFIAKWNGTAKSIPKDIKDKLTYTGKQNIFSVLGHTRYGTNSNLNECNIHPVYAKKNNCFVALVMNGEVSFTKRWFEHASKNGVEVHGTNDTANIAAKLCVELEKKPLKKALIDLYKNLFPFGGFTILGVIINKKNKKHFFYMKDGLRPLYSAKISNSFFYFSETSHVTGLPAENIKEVQAGEIGIYSFPSKTLSKIDLSSVLKGTIKKALCPFEIAYFQKHTSRLNGNTMNSIRKEFGAKLAEEFPPKDNHTISWVPKSGISATQGYYEKAVEMGKHCEFKQIIMRKKKSEQKEERSFLGARSKSLNKRLKKKFEINLHETKNSDIILIDDSIVRGSVSAWLTGMLKKAKAKNVFFLSAWPPMISSCKAGIDMPKEQLIAPKILPPAKIIEDKKKLEKELEKSAIVKGIGKIRFDKIKFISQKSMSLILKKHLKGKICMGCFNLKYNYVCDDNKENIPEWLKEFIKKNKVEIPEQIKI